MAYQAPGLYSPPETNRTNDSYNGASGSMTPQSISNRYTQVTQQRGGGGNPYQSAVQGTAPYAAALRRQPGASSNIGAPQPVGVPGQVTQGVNRPRSPQQPGAQQQPQYGTNPNRISEPDANGNRSSTMIGWGPPPPEGTRLPGFGGSPLDNIGNTGIVNSPVEPPTAGRGRPVARPIGDVPPAQAAPPMPEPQAPPTNVDPAQRGRINPYPAIGGATPIPTPDFGPDSNAPQPGQPGAPGGMPGASGSWQSSYSQRTPQEVAGLTPGNPAYLDDLMSKMGASRDRAMADAAQQIRHQGGVTGMANSGAFGTSMSNELGRIGLESTQQMSQAQLGVSEAERGRQLQEILGRLGLEGQREGADASRFGSSQAADASAYRAGLDYSLGSRGQDFDRELGLRGQDINQELGYAGYDVDRERNYMQNQLGWNQQQMDAMQMLWETSPDMMMRYFGYPEGGFFSVGP